MALGDLVQMLEGLPGSTGCAGCGLADVPEVGSRGPVVKCADGTFGFMDECEAHGGTFTAAESTPHSWTPYVLGGAALLMVWALFFRERR